VKDESKIAVNETVFKRAEPRRAELLKPYDAAEADEGPDLRLYWRILQKRRWTVFTVIAVVFTVAVIGTLKQKPVYRAMVLIEIQKENPNLLTVQELFQLENVSDNYLETQYKVLQSETLARRVIAELHLGEAKEFNGSGGARLAGGNQGRGSEAQDSTGEQAVLRAFAARLTVEPVPRSRLVRISFESQEPQMAARVVNVLAANYIQQNLENRWDATQKASEWLSQQLQGLKARLEKSEDDLQSYAQANGLIYLESEKGQTENIVNARLRDLQEELTKAQAIRYERESFHRLVETGDYRSLPGIVESKSMQELTTRLVDLERQKAELTALFSETYPKVKEIQSQIDRVQQLLAAERQRAAERISNEYLAAVRREDLIARAFEEQRKQANVVAGRSVQYNILKREVDTNKQLYEGLLQRLKEAGVSAGLKASNIRIVDAALPPISPIRPRVSFNLMVGFLVGLVCAVSLAFLQERIDNTLKNPDDIERFLGIPALALIPSRASLAAGKRGVYGLSALRFASANGNGHAANWEGLTEQKGWVRIDGDHGVHYSQLSEAFRGLRTSVLLSTAEGPPQSLTFISAEPGEGKTTVASNLAISLAQLGKRVLLIDGDMRRPCVHKLFGMPDHSTGLANYLAGQENWRSLVRPTGIGELDSLLCGPVPPNPSELLSSERMQTLLREAINRYHFVLVDAPPLLNVADGRILATMVQGAVLVVKGGATPRELVQRAQSCVRDVGAHLIGVVLNDVNLHHDGYYYSYYRDREYGRENGDASKAAKACGA